MLAASPLAARWEGPPPRVPLPTGALPAVAATLPPGALEEKLAALLEASFAGFAVKAGAPQAAIAVAIPGVGMWTDTYGREDDEPPVFWWASVGKLATSALIYQLVDEGVLALDDRLERWFPELPGADAITVDKLLRHTSGLFSFNEDEAHRQQRGYHPPEELLAVAAGHDLLFAPGTNWRYSNTGYLLLGLIAEELTGESFADLVRTRLAEPRGLASLRVITRDDDAPLVAPANQPATTRGEIASIAGAGAIAATPADMLRFLHAWLTGELFAAEHRETALATLYPMFGQPLFSGAGIMVLDVPDPAAPTVWIGHSGGAPGGKGLVVYDLEREVWLALVHNRQAPAEAVANGLLKALDPALAAAARR